MSVDGVSVVAIAPTINKMLKTLGKISDMFHIMRHYSKELDFLGLQLDTEILVLQDGFRFLMQLHEDEEIILEDLDGSLWSDASLNTRSSQFLGQNSNECNQHLARTQEVLREIEKCFVSASKGQSFQEFPWPQQHVMSITFRKSLCEKTVASLQDYNLQLSVLRSAIQQQQLISLKWFEWNEPNHAVLENFDAIRRAATKAYIALCGSCSFVCQHQHNAKLSLDAVVKEGEFARLSLIISPEAAERTIPTTTLPAWNYVEAAVTDYGGSKISTTAEPIYRSMKRDHINDSRKGLPNVPGYRPIQSNLLSPTKNFMPVTQFPSPKVNKRRACGRLLPHLLKNIPEMAAFESIRATWPGKVPNSRTWPKSPWNMELNQPSLECKGIYETIDYPGSHLDDVAIHKISDSYVEMESVSLADLLKNSAQKLSIEFQLGVAYRLASAVLQYHSTPWLDNEWGIQDICFCNAPDLYSDEALETLHLAVKLRCCVAEKWLSEGTMTGGNDGIGLASSSGNTTLFKLGVALIELAYSKPLQWLKEEQDRDDFTAIRRLSNRMPPLGPNYQKIVQYCLRGRLGPGDDLLQTKLQWAFCNDVLFPLKQMLKSLEIENQARDIGMRVLAEGDSLVKADIIFVHGLGGGSIGTWNRSGVCWPRDLLPNCMNNCARIMSWGYNTSSYADPNGLVLLAETLLKDIEMKRQTVIERQRPIVFVCHSLGGLVVKQALLQTQDCNEQDRDLGNIYACTSGIVFFGTPHRGNSSASLSQLVANIANIFLKQTYDNMWHVLSRNQNALVTQSKSFEYISADMLLVSIFEEQPIDHAGIVVPEFSSRMEGLNTTSFGIAENHIYLCKFTDPHSKNFKRVARQIFELVNEAVESQIKKQDVILNRLRLENVGCGYEAVQRNQVGTCSWIFENSRFSDWLQQDRGLFWISGKAGSGKSTMMKYLVDNLKTRRPLGNCSIVNIFIPRHTESSQKSMVGLLRAIVLQILEYFRDLIPVAFPKQWECLQRKAPSLEFEWSETTLWETLLSIMDHAAMPSNICLFIDGLDNYHGPIREVLNFLHNLVKHESINMRIKACFSSRSLHKCGIEFKLMSTIRLHEHNRPDLAKYVYDKITTHSVTTSLISSGCITQSLLKTLINEIVENSSGDFLRMKLALDDALQTITMDEVLMEPSNDFSSILDDLEGALHQHVVSISKDWYSKGDLNIPEFFQFLIVHPQPLRSYMDRKSQTSAGSQSGLLGVSEMHEGPISIDEARVYFLHQTASEFLVSEKMADIWNDLLQHKSPEFWNARHSQNPHNSLEDDTVPKVLVLFVCADNLLDHPVPMPNLTMSVSKDSITCLNDRCVTKITTCPCQKDAQLSHMAIMPNSDQNKLLSGLTTRIMHLEEQSHRLAPFIRTCDSNPGNQSPTLSLKLLLSKDASLIQLVSGIGRSGDHLMKVFKRSAGLDRLRSATNSCTISNAKIPYAILIATHLHPKGNGVCAKSSPSKVSEGQLNIPKPILLFQGYYVLRESQSRETRMDT